MIIIFVGGGDVIVWGKLPSFSGWLTSLYRRVIFPHNRHHVDVYINRKVYIYKIFKNYTGQETVFTYRK